VCCTVNLIIVVAAVAMAMQGGDGGGGAPRVLLAVSALCFVVPWLVVVGKSMVQELF
jgi:hypothetical protein